MISIISSMTESDRSEVLSMMDIFYSSPAVLSSGSEKIFRRDIDNCIGDCPFLEGYVFRDGAEIHGYAMLAKSFSTEFGKCCVWIEDLYIKENFRGTGIGGRFLSFVAAKYHDCVLRLEVEEENERAVAVYKKHGFEMLPYSEMINKGKL